MRSVTSCMLVFHNNFCVIIFFYSAEWKVNCLGTKELTIRHVKEMGRVGWGVGGGLDEKLVTICFIVGFN